MISNKKAKPTQYVQLMVRYGTGHRAMLSRGWKPYGDKKPMPVELADLIAAGLRLNGADVRLHRMDTPHRKTGVTPSK